MKTKITESQLKARIESLEAKLDEISAQTAGQAVGSVAGAPVAAANWVGQKVGQAYDAAKQGVQNFAQGVQQGYGQMTGGASGAASGSTTKYPTTPQEIKAFQQANGLTADGVIGPKTQAALAKAGLKPAAPTKPAAGQSAAQPGTTKPAAAQQTQTQKNFAAAGMAGQEMRTPAEIAASQDMSSANDGSTTSGAAPQARNTNAGLTPDDPRWQGPKPTAAAPAAPAAPAATESITFGQDPSLARIIQLSR